MYILESIRSGYILLPILMNRGSLHQSDASNQPNADHMLHKYTIVPCITQKRPRCRVPVACDNNCVISVGSAPVPPGSSGHSGKINHGSRISRDG